MPVRAKKRKKPRTLGVTGRGIPYLWLREPRSDRPAVWIIMDKGKQVRSTECGPGDEPAALAQLEDYKASLHKPVTKKNLRADQVLIADVVMRYLAVKQSTVARPAELGQRMTTILEWWGERTLADIDSVTCAEYVRSRVGQPWKTHARLGTGKDGVPARRGHSKPTKQRVVTEGGARRELEDLRAAVNQAIGDGLTRENVKVTTPDKSPGRKRFLEKYEAAAMVRAAWRKREIQKGHVTDRFPARHLARYLIVALRTGTRSTAICRASFIPEIGRPWMELTRDAKDRPVAKFHRLALGTKEAENKRYPTITLPDQLAAQLWRWHHRLGQRYVLEWQGRPVDTTKRSFANLAHELGLGDDVVRHTLRHTAATWGMQAGTNLSQLSGYLGMSIETLTRVYGHYSPDHLEEARQAMGGKKKRAA
ncbi:hypothetical protein ASG51_21090 [Methylobacterium sp. Leaf465]|uniref:tyrosine-type recombinase/integrase n=1 Tax=Methylobacterium sp. Leaf465 TaxID=1736385 RepID=UPI0006FA2A44|nr:tyrosine-type recombinase/integrase [Methylobacterium sp. Leaf465]KQT80895.1 hypothetical protein ASG51_21090 [Methylobacterium sp. Leaf465]